MFFTSRRSERYCISPSPSCRSHVFGSQLPPESRRPPAPLHDKSKPPLCILLSIDPEFCLLMRITASRHNDRNRFLRLGEPATCTQLCTLDRKHEFLRPEPVHLIFCRKLCKQSPDRVNSFSFTLHRISSAQIIGNRIYESASPPKYTLSCALRTFSCFAQQPA